MGCRRRFPQRDLVRLAGDGRGGVVVDRHAPGRGAWLCPASTTCHRTALRRGVVARALRMPVEPAALAGAVAALAENLADLHVAGRSPGTPCSTTKG